MSERKAVIKNADMSEDMQVDAIDCATQVRLADYAAGLQRTSSDSYLSREWHGSEGKPGAARKRGHSS